MLFDGSQQRCAAKRLVVGGGKQVVRLQAIVAATAIAEMTIMIIELSWLRGTLPGALLRALERWTDAEYASTPVRRNHEKNTQSSLCGSGVDSGVLWRTGVHVTDN